MSSGASQKKLVLVVIDALKPAMLERAIAVGRAPALARIMQEGVYVDDCVAAFPSVTPVCAASITTGVGPDAHHIPSMNWYHREEARYVEYGSSFSASRQFGVLRSLTDTVYRMNAEHLNPEVLTVFESLDDIDVRTAGTTYLIYRGRYPHEVANETALARIVTSTLFRRTIDGPKELFYADIYASRKTGCRGQLGMPGVRDQHTGCVGAYLEENDLYDFMLFSLPDNDAWSHKNGPHSQVTSVAAADRQLERLMHAGGGPDAFLESHAVVVCSDHSQAPVEERIRLQDSFAEFEVATPSPARSENAEIALSPAQRSAMVYALDEERREQLVARSVAVALETQGVDLACWLTSASEAVIRNAAGAELRFAPDGPVEDLRGDRWHIDGALAAIGASERDGRLHTPSYPDALSRVWSALKCPTAGDVLLSAAPNYEFVDWGGADHVGGGSHGSLHSSDSLAVMMWCGTGPEARAAREQWSLKDITPMIREHFGARPDH
ncbi:MAG TPA: alkaline phosphatase family protein [Solirubrobacteraceae bacterium]|nr:alkaline phosphatase family protein [Solirubrobacteraceae bacterium]